MGRGEGREKVLLAKTREMTREIIREYAMCKLIFRAETCKERCSDKTRGKKDSEEIHTEITQDIIVVEETGRPERHFDA